MKILYLSSHSVLEWDELSILTEIDSVLPPEHKLYLEVFSMGAFSNPTQSGDFMRSVIPHGKFYPELYQLAMECDKDNLHPGLIDWCDLVLMMHNSGIPGQKEQQRWLVKNWSLMKEKGKQVVWRSIGQSTPAIEDELGRYKKVGLKILRYSPLEEKIPNYAGSDGMIRFCKDEDEFTGWTGDRKQVITVTQSFKKRGDHLGYSIWDKVTAGFPRKVFGNDNADLGEDNGGQRSYDELKRDLRGNRVYFYFGTIPAPYTLSLIEAMMTGIPVVAVGSVLREHHAYPWPNYEIPEIITNGVNGYVSDNIPELRSYIQNLMDDGELAMRIGEAGRKTAIEFFSKKQKVLEWADFLRRL